MILRPNVYIQFDFRGIIGPWSHDWPDVSVPGPNIGFMDECLDFWNHHLKDKPSEKQEKAPKLIWYQCVGSVPPLPSIKAQYID